MSDIKAKTIKLIDELKATCQAKGLGNDGNEFKIITQVFLYKFLNDKFGYTLKTKDTRYKEQFAKAAKWDEEYAKLAKRFKAEKYELLAFHTMGFFKYENLGIENPLKNTPPLEKDALSSLQSHLDTLMT